MAPDSEAGVVESLAHVGAAAASVAAQALSGALGQPVRIGRIEARPAAPGELENENLDLYHPVDVAWEVAGSAY